MIKALALSTLLAGCTLYADIGSEPPTGDGTVQAALVPVLITSDLDLLFVVDDSPGSVQLQQALQTAFPSFLQTLGPPSDRLPNLHIGVVSNDLGTSAANDPAPGPAIGLLGQGGCQGNGKAGNLVTASGITGTYISDVLISNGRETNYTGTLSDAFASISSLGGNGCGFEQPLLAAQRALNNNPSNVGFLRELAPLAIVVVTNEDDCSLSHSVLMGTDTATLGPLQSFRCTRFGVTCDDFGSSPDKMNTIGPKGRCHANPSTQYLASVDNLAAFFKSLKHDPRNILFGAIVGVASSLEVELRTPPGGGSAIPALAHACTWPAMMDAFDAADPAIRITDLASRFTRNRVQSVCGLDMTGAMTGLAREMRNMMARDACLARDIKIPAECTATETHGGGLETALPACDGTQQFECWRLVSDPVCPSQGLRLDIIRTQAPAPDVMTSLRCKI